MTTTAVRSRSGIVARATLSCPVCAGSAIPPRQNNLSEWQLPLDASSSFWSGRGGQGKNLLLDRTPCGSRRVGGQSANYAVGGGKRTDGRSLPSAIMELRNQTTLGLLSNRNHSDRAQPDTSGRGPHRRVRAAADGNAALSNRSATLPSAAHEIDTRVLTEWIARRTNWCCRKKFFVYSEAAARVRGIAVMMSRGAVISSARFPLAARRRSESSLAL